ncbi:MAG: hypothetical protein II273_05080 [Lachnospiraceae bacterium]|nr:hypothetical protein [Lachnospiraceae bacterium]
MKEDLIMKFRNASKKELFWLLLSVIILGFCLSFLDKTSFGTDPCTTFNLGISKSLGLSLGNWQALFNSFLFLFVFLFGRDQIGWGTLANMFVVGYSYDFFSWINGMLLPADLFDTMLNRLLITIPILALFIIAVAIYISIEQGIAPYDAIPNMISKKLVNIPFKLIRMGWDISITILGILLGEKIGLITIIMAFTIGPAISFVDKHIVSKLIR